MPERRPLVLNSNGFPAEIPVGDTLPSSILPGASGGTSTPNAISFSDANRTILASECTGSNLIVRQTGTLTTSRTLTLPLANSVPVGYQIHVADESGSPSWWYKLNIANGSGDTIDGIQSNLLLDKPWQCATLVSNGVNGWVVSNNSTNRRGLFVTEEDCLYGGTSIGKGYSITTGSGGSANSIIYSGDVSAVGVAQLSTGATNNSGRAMIHTTTSSIVFGTAKWRQYGRVLLQVAPDVVENFILMLGFTNDVTNEGANGVYLLGDLSISANLLACTSSGGGGSRTRVDTGIAISSLVTLSTWFEYGIEVNAAATAARFFANGAEIVTPITTNIPNTSNRSVGVGALIRKTAGTSSRILFVDQLHYLYELSTPR